MMEPQLTKCELQLFLHTRLCMWLSSSLAHSLHSPSCFFCFSGNFLLIDWSSPILQLYQVSISSPCQCLNGRAYCSKGGTGAHLWLSHQEVFNPDWLLELSSATSLPIQSPSTGPGYAPFLRFNCQSGQGGCVHVGP